MPPPPCKPFPRHGADRKGDFKSHFMKQIMPYFRTEGLLTTTRVINKWLQLTGNVGVHSQQPQVLGRVWIKQCREELDREQKSEELPPPPPPPPQKRKDLRTIHDHANKLAPLIFDKNKNYDDIKTLLNFIFDRPEAPEEFRLPLGDMIEAFQAEKLSYDSLRKSSTKLGRQQKQTLLAAKVHMDGENNCLNRPYISRLCKSQYGDVNNRLASLVVENRKRFNEGGFVLFDEGMLEKGDRKSRVRTF